VDTILIQAEGSAEIAGAVLTAVDDNDHLTGPVGDDRFAPGRIGEA